MDFTDFDNAYANLRLYGQHEKKEAKQAFKQFRMIVEAIEKANLHWQTPADMRRAAVMYGDMVKVAQMTRQPRHMAKYQMKARQAYALADGMVDNVEKAFPDEMTNPGAEKPQHLFPGMKIEYFKNPNAKDDE